jgi:putative transcriptional regulator
MEIKQGFEAVILTEKKDQNHTEEIRMPIIVNLDIMMAKRRIGLTELAGKVNITAANLSILKNNKARAIRFSTLEEICRVLDCQPGDILEYVKSRENPNEK